MASPDPHVFLSEGNARAFFYFLFLCYVKPEYILM
jgi:hypothetical protein